MNKNGYRVDFRVGKHPCNENTKYFLMYILQSSLQYTCVCIPATKKILKQNKNEKKPKLSTRL